MSPSPLFSVLLSSSLLLLFPSRGTLQIIDFSLFLSQLSFLRNHAAKATTVAHMQHVYTTYGTYIQKVYRAILWTGRSSAHRPIFAFRPFPDYYYGDIKGISAEPEQQGGGEKTKSDLLINLASEGGREGWRGGSCTEKEEGRKVPKSTFGAPQNPLPPPFLFAVRKTRCLVDGILTHFAPSLPLSDVSLMLGLFFSPPLPLPAAPKS